MARPREHRHGSKDVRRGHVRNTPTGVTMEEIRKAGTGSTTPGPAGPAGPAGATGPAGAAGATGPTGATGAPGAPGVASGAGLGFIGGDTFGGEASGEGTHSLIPGPRGLPGEGGAPGPPGDDGEDGKPGEMGPPGPKGAPGAPGPMGLVWPDGAAEDLIGDPPLPLPLYPADAWVTIPFNAASYGSSGGAMTWTLTSGDAITMRYLLLGRPRPVAAILIVHIKNSSVGGTPETHLRYGLGPATGLSTVVEFEVPGNAIDNGVYAPIRIWMNPAIAAGQLYISKRDGTAWTASANLTDVSGSVIIPLA